MPSILPQFPADHLKTSCLVSNHYTKLSALIVSQGSTARGTYWKLVSVCTGHFQLYHTTSSGRCLEMLQQPLPARNFQQASLRTIPVGQLCFRILCPVLTFHVKQSLRELLTATCNAMRCLIIMLRDGKCYVPGI